MSTAVPHWPADTPAALQAFYGDPGSVHLNEKWVAANLARVSVPWRMTYDGQVVKTVQIHRKCAASLETVFGALWDHAGHNQAAIDATGLHLYGGSFNFRPVRGSTSVKSCHAFGAALDFDPAHHPLGNKARFPDWVVAAFKAQGWFYGGDFHSRPDGMHFQATSTA